MSLQYVANSLRQPRTARSVRRNYFLFVFSASPTIDVRFGSIQVYRFFCCSGELAVREFLFVDSLL